MKTYEIKVTQEMDSDIILGGYYDGTIQIEASSPEAALNKLKRMSKRDIDEKADWTHGDDYNGNVDSIEIDDESINEV